MKKNFKNDKQEKTVLHILSKTSVGTAAINSIKNPTRCIRCGATLTQLESIKYGYCRECAKHDIDTFREKALKKYFLIVLALLLCEILGTVVQRLDFKNSIYVTLIVSVLSLYLIRKLVVKKIEIKKRKKLTTFQKTMVYIVVDFALIGGIFAAALVQALFIFCFLGGMGYLIYRDIKNYNKIKQDFENFDRQYMILERKSSAETYEPTINENTVATANGESEEKSNISDTEYIKVKEDSSQQDDQNSDLWII